MEGARLVFGGSFGGVLSFLAVFGPFLVIFGHFWPKYLLENPRFSWRRVGLRPGWCGNALMLFVKNWSRFGRVGVD